MRVAAPATPGKSCASSCVLPLRHLRPLKRTQSNGLRGSSRRKARGWVSDRLKNTTEEIELKELWDVHVKGVRKVSKELEFVGSESYPEVQLADVLLGRQVGRLAPYLSTDESTLEPPTTGTGTGTSTGADRTTSIRRRVAMAERTQPWPNQRAAMIRPRAHSSAT